MFRLKITGIILVAVISLIIGGCEKEGTETKSSKSNLGRPVKVQLIGNNAIGGMNNNYSGKAEGIKESVLSFRVSGVLKQLDFEVGQIVKSGQVAAALDESDYVVKINGLENKLKSAIADLAQLTKGARIEDIRIYESKLKSSYASVSSTKAAIRSAKSSITSAKASLDAALSDHKRINALYSKKAASKRELESANSTLELRRSEWTQRNNELAQLKEELVQMNQNVETSKEELEKAKIGGREEEVDAQEAQVKSLQSDLNQAKLNLKYTRLIIPFDGTIATKHVSDFEQVSAGTPIYNLIDVSEIEVQISVPDSVISSIYQGQEVTVEFLGIPSQKFSGEVSKIGISADVRTLTYPVFVRLDNKKGLIRPGMTANVGFQSENKHSGYPIIPIHTILQDKVTNEQFVWLFDMESNQAQRQVITLGGLSGNQVEVISGLKTGDMLIIAGVHKVRPDIKVRILE